VPTTAKPVRLSGHARQQIRFRGGPEQEILETIHGESWTPAEHNRIECRMDFPFNQVWNGKRYATKQVLPIFVEEPNEIIVVTVYVYYF
jgi:hypothetical protein